MKTRNVNEELIQGMEEAIAYMHGKNISENT